MWIDMFAKDDIIPAMVDVKPPAVERYELRVTIWSVVDVQLVDDNYFTGEKYSDIYIKGFIKKSNIPFGRNVAILTIS